MSSNTPQTISLYRASCELLASMLNQNGWTSKRREIVASGSLLDKLEPATSDRPIFTGQLSNGLPTDQLEWNKYQATIKSWNNELITINFEDAEYQATISALKHFSDASKLPANRYAAQLLITFKLSE